MSECVDVKNRYTENWFAKTGLSWHARGKSCKRWKSPLKLLPMLPALFEEKQEIVKCMLINNYKRNEDWPNAT